MASDILWLDLETYSEVPITSGTYKYAASAEVDIFAWAFGDEAPQTIDLQTCGRGERSAIADILESARVVVAHNAIFDRNVLRLGNMKLEVPIPKWRCSRVMALAHALPGGLEKLGPLLGLPADMQKQAEGEALMQLFCKPRPKNHKLRRATADTHPEERERYREYAAHDVIAMREIVARLPRWNMDLEFPKPGEPWLPAHTELHLWHLDQAKNDRGFRIDTELMHGALRAVAGTKVDLDAKCMELTDGALSSATKRDAMIQFMAAEYGFILPDMKASTLERLLDDPRVDDGMRELIRLRLATCTTSTAKYRAVQRAVSDDGRLRGTLQFNGASRTRRTAGRVFQPHNLPSRGLLGKDATELGIEAMKLGVEKMLFPDVMLLASSAIRGLIVPSVGKKLTVADLSNIEGRDLAWLAGEEWKLKAFRDFDTVLGEDGQWHHAPSFRGKPPPLVLDAKGEPVRKGPDLYKMAYAKSFGLRPEDVTKDQRQVGKVQELACGYQGSIGAFITFSLAYGIDLDEMAAKALPTLPEEALVNASDLLDWFASKKISVPGLPRQTLVVILCMVNGWRSAHPNVVALWKGLEELFRSAVRHPRIIHKYGRFKAVCTGPWLRIQMPSGRSLCYPFPEVDKAGKLSYMGVCNYTKKWKRIHTYGGKVAENACQGFARDVLYDAHPHLGPAGYDLILDVHDENLTETDVTGDCSAEELSWLMTRPPSFMPDRSNSYAPDLPLAAAGFESFRYRKD